MACLLTTQKYQNSRTSNSAQPEAVALALRWPTRPRAADVGSDRMVSEKCRLDSKAESYGLLSHIDARMAIRIDLFGIRSRRRKHFGPI
jgi:hypothetical protein